MNQGPPKSKRTDKLFPYTTLYRSMGYYKELAFPTASLVFCLLGVPVGIASKRSGRIGGFAVGVLVVIVYYLLNVACEFLVMTANRSEEHTSELQSLMRISYAVFCLQKKKFFYFFLFFYFSFL